MEETTTSSTITGAAAQKVTGAGCGFTGRIGEARGICSQVLDNINTSATNMAEYMALWVIEDHRLCTPPYIQYMRRVALSDKIYDIVVVGSNSAGYVAVIQAARSRLDTLVLQDFEAGGRYGVEHGSTGKLALVRRRWEVLGGSRFDTVETVLKADRELYDGGLSGGLVYIVHRGHPRVLK